MTSSTMNPAPANPRWMSAVAVLLTALAAALGGLASSNAAEFYAQLQLPPWAPPASWFGPVWSVLYALMAAAAWLALRRADASQARQAFWLHIAQLSANALWSWLFFRWHLGGLALADVILLWVLIVATTAAFWRVRPLAGALMLPYAAWVAFAAVLNATLWFSNPSLLA